LGAAILVAAQASSSTPAVAQPSTLRQAVESAWALQPRAAAATARGEEFDARATAAQATFPGPAALGAEHWTDAITRNEGFRKYAGEIAVPLWLPGQKERAQAVVRSEQEAWRGDAQAARLKLAGEVREAFWQARADQGDVALARGMLEALDALAGDVRRRVVAGELARVDANRAEAEAQAQRVALAEASARAARSLAMFRTLTGLPRLIDADGEPEARRLGEGAHPAALAAQRVFDAARARLDQARGDTRDNPEVGVGTIRERSEAVRPFEQIVTFRVRIPLGSDHRNRPRIAAASAEMAEAQAAWRLAQAQIDGEIVAAEAENELARGALAPAEARIALARDSRALMERAFRAGEADLPTLLRADRDLREAELAGARARLAIARARSRLNQAYGVMP
jgi:cobalt-zinc-cadmium efflux system outer membrane protein